jgi:transcription-repair coupling factor (superfamily II helicase)
MTDGPRRIQAGGAPEGFDARLVLRERDRAGGPVIHIARDDKRLAAMREALAFFAPDAAVLCLPAWDCLPYDRVSPNPGIAAERLAVLSALARGVGGAPVVLTTLNAAMQRVPARATLAGATFSARLGDRVDIEALAGFLVRMGFAQAATVSEPGDFALRGGIVDVWAPGGGGPVRLDLFGDTLDAVRRFDPATQRSTDRLTGIDLAPVSEVILDPASITRFRQAYRAEFGAGGTEDPLYEAVSAGRKHAGMEHWLPFFHDRLETLFDYLPGAAVTMDDRLDAARAARWETLDDLHEARREALAARGRPDSVYKPCPPDLLYLDDAAWDAALADRAVLRLSPSPQPPGPGLIDAGARAGRNFAPERQQDGARVFDALTAHVGQRLADGHVVIALYSEGARERMGALMADHGLTGARPIRDARDLPPGKGGLFLAVWPLEQGFEAPGLTVIAEPDVLGDRLIGGARRRRRAENALTEAQGLTPGDLVVHVEHGIGRFRGLETITALGAPHDCVALEYAGGDRLFLPVENIELLSRYGHEEGMLDRLGGGAWQARKARMKERIREIAERLMRIAAERVLRAAPVITPPEGLWDAFCARFPYVETDDQTAAIAAVLDDLERGTPMDRLVVGDVGFGKTEVAMRAAFVAAMSGRQVAVIAPTTLLARQHYRSFADRFRGFPLVVRPLSRFVPAREAGATREGLADGSVDIVVGTHALLAKSVRFRDLGLLVIDEEQHFGVAHKERLKELRAEIHVLTLTATPIPRTLQMALSGVRDLSIIATPPIDRLAIRTYLSEFDTVTVREALLREKFRGGQSFIVVPRVADIPEMEAFLREQVPEVGVVVAHGQLATGDLDERMNNFYDGRHDVLLATSIVESGLDIPTANTMIVHRADMFGLAQLYQIRGRVGRAKTRAYCYLTTRPRAPLTPQAERRLKLLVSLDSLGAGFNLASHDLEQRGAGNLMGEEQSGHIREVGFELYQHMLEETIARLKSGEIAGTPADDDWSPQINLGVPVLIPEAYVADLDVRLGLYRRLSGLSGKVEMEGFAAELIDRFGPLPREVNMLLLVVRIKSVCKRAGIARLDAGPRGATVQFHGDRFANPAGLVAYLQAEGGTARLRENRLVIARDWTTEAERIKGAFAIARDLAAQAVADPATPPAAAARPAQAPGTARPAAPAKAAMPARKAPLPPAPPPRRPPSPARPPTRRR